MAQASETLVRFAVARRDDASGEPTGIFQEAARLRDEGLLDPAETVWLEDVWSWLNENLERPPRIWSSANAAGRRSGISWMKTSAVEHVSRLRELAAILQNHGIVVEQTHTTNPGYIVSEDEHQVVAVPFKR